MVGTGIFSQSISGTVLAAHEYKPNHYVAAVSDENSMIRSVYFTADSNCGLITDIDVDPAYFANAHKAMAFGLRYV